MNQVNDIENRVLAYTRADIFEACMESQIIESHDAAYDHVGQYEQDRINGFDDRFLERFVSVIEPRSEDRILDAMAGNGNLTRRLFEFCKGHGTAYPSVTVLEYSREQANFARQSLQSMPAEVIWGDILSMQSFETGERLESESFDTVVIKSSNHEIPLALQQTLYDNVFRALKQGGKFVNLGFLFDEVVERDEFREIARTKDRLAGMESAVRNRHFLTREEMYGRLQGAGFDSIGAVGKFHYEIRTAEVARQYFEGNLKLYSSLEHQVAQVRAIEMRRKGMISFTEDDSLMHCPGEITVASKP